MTRVLVYRRHYLPKSETFIYQQLIGHSRVQPIVLTRKKMNLDQFPYSPVYRRRTLKGLAPWLRRKRIRCLHARFGTAGVELLPIARKTGIPLITSFHGFDATKRVKTDRHYRRQLRRLFRHGQAFTVVSNDMKRKLIKLGCPARKITLIRSGIQLRKFPFLPPQPVQNQAFRLLSVGRLTEKKGMDTLIKAFRHVVRTYPQTTLTIVGEGEERSRLRRLVKTYGLKHAITLTGALPHQQVQQEMSRCHLFVIACQTAKDGNQEGIPNVLMEAMATGRPVVSTYHAGIPELIRHGVHGYLAPERSPRHLARTILRALEEQERWSELTARARQKVEEQHDIVKQREKLEQLYLKMIRKAR